MNGCLLFLLYTIICVYVSSVHSSLEKNLNRISHKTYFQTLVRLRYKTISGWQSYKRLCRKILGNFFKKNHQIMVFEPIFLHYFLHYEHTVGKDVPKSDFSKKDKSTMSLVPLLFKLGTKDEDNRFDEISIGDKWIWPFYPKGQVNLSWKLRKKWKNNRFFLKFFQTLVYELKFDLLVENSCLFWPRIHERQQIKVKWPIKLNHFPDTITVLSLGCP